MNYPTGKVGPAREMTKTPSWILLDDRTAPLRSTFSGKKIITTVNYPKSPGAYL